MSQTDRQTDKSSRWQFTAYAEQWPLFEAIPPAVAEWGWQKEVCPSTQKEHYQGYLRTPSQVRFSALKKLFPGVHLEVAKNWQALINYCNKEETRVPGSIPVSQVNTMYTKYSYAERVGKWLVERHPIQTWQLWLPNELYNAMEEIICADITSGRREIAWIIVSPDWKLYWKSYRYILKSHSINASSQIPSPRPAEAPCSPQDPP